MEIPFPKYHVVAIDYGAKHNILRCLAQLRCKITVVPATTDAKTILGLKPGGIFLSNGPGDPAATGEYAVPVIKELINSGKPIFGICLGHQLLARALGARTGKMHHGHRGANHPVKNMINGKVEITSQNHGFVVLKDSLPDALSMSHISLFDDSLEGIELRDRPVFSVQYHPGHLLDRKTANTYLNVSFRTSRERSNSVPKRTDLQSICIIGAGPIVIGQACEFDYSGTQACKALRDEGYRVILINSNPATIMTDPDTADATYVEPITPETVTKVLERENPDAVLPTMGGQTALNTALDLFHDGTLKRLKVELIGAKAEVIAKAEDRSISRSHDKNWSANTPKRLS